MDVRPSSTSQSRLVTALFLLVAPLGCNAPPDPAAPPPEGPTACASSEITLADGRCLHVGPPLDPACAPGELALPDGRCQPAGRPLDAACAPGELALADGRCQAAGVPPEACAAGFDADDRRGCEPVLPASPCAEGQMAVPGDTACREVAPCGQAPYGDLPDEAATQFVDASYAAADSDGSPEKPWRTVQAGIDAAAPGAIVAVAAGRYEEGVIVAGKRVRLRGRCPAMVEVVGLTGGEAAIQIREALAAGSEVRGIAASGSLRGIQVTGADSVAIDAVWVRDGERAGVEYAGAKRGALRGSLIEQNQGFGVLVSGSDATIDASVVRATRSDPAGELGAGIGALNDAAGARAAVAVQGSLVEDNQPINLVASGSDATIDASVVRNGRSDATGEGGWGIFVQPDSGGRGRLTLTRSLVERNRVFGVGVSASDAAIEASVVRGTLPNFPQGTGRGVDVESNPQTHDRGTLTLRASLIEENYEKGVFVLGSDATVEACVLRGTKAFAAELSGRGVSAECYPGTDDRAALTMRASVVEQNRREGVFIQGADATIESSVVRDTLPEPGGINGQGIEVRAERSSRLPTSLTLRSSLVEQNSSEGILIEDAGATIEATIVRGTKPNRDGTLGRGVAVQGGRERAGLTMTGALIEQNHEIGVFIGASDATIASSVVRGTLSDGRGEFGRGIVAQGNPETGARAALTLLTSLISDNREVGVFVAGADATIEASAVDDTQPNGAGELGVGIGAIDAPWGGRGGLSLRTSRVDGNHRAGVYLARSDATIEASEIEGTLPEPAGGAFGDGVLVDEGTCQMTALRSAMNARAGIFFVESAGVLSSVYASTNRFGLVLEGTVQPTFDQGSSFDDNIERDQIVDGDLPVPTAIPAIP